MKRHSGQQIYEARLRAIAKWKRYRDTWVLDYRTHPQARPPWRPTPEDYWGQEGRFNKLSISCDCSFCSVGRWERKFRTHKHSYYRKLDQIEESAY